MHAFHGWERGQPQGFRRILIEEKPPFPIARQSENGSILLGDDVVFIGKTRGLPTNRRTIPSTGRENGCKEREETRRQKRREEVGEAGQGEEERRREAQAKRGVHE